MKKIIFVTFSALLLGAACAKKTPATTTNPPVTNITVTNTSDTTNTQPTVNTNTTASFAFTTPKKSAHYESNTPAHASVLAAAPINIVIDFNFDLHAKSSISVMQDGQEYATGPTTVDDNKLTLRRGLKADAPNGLYTVNYNACWPDGSCHDGHFQFAIDRTLASSYMDLRGQTAVTVRLKNLAFSPMDIRINSGTTVTWINDDSVEHYVNTDSHPAHTYYAAQNSKALKTGDQFSQTFATAGAYPYHCSAHAGIMTGSIIVE